jgi:high-affinity Fe2+/Pb2+ permease
MNRYLKIGLFGFLLWLIPFAVSVLIFPLRTSQRPLFESIMPVVIAIWTVFFSILFLSKKKSDFLTEGIFIGLAWLLISIVLDLMIFIEGPLKMPLWDYVTDIAVTYLMIPVITTGFGYLMEQRARINAKQEDNWDSKK